MEVPCFAPIPHLPSPFINEDYLSVNDSSTYLINGEMKNSITLLSPVLISAVTAIPGARGISLSLTRMVKRLGFNLTL